MPAPNDTARFVRPRFAPGLELVSASYQKRRFPVHTHPEYVVGAIVAGSETLSVGGRAHTAGAGATLFLHPDEPHANAALGDARLEYRVFYLAPACLADAAPLVFPRPVSRDPALFAAITGAHGVLSAGADRLEQETAFAQLRLALTRLSTPEARLGDAGAHRGVRKVKAFIDAHYAEAFGLAALAEVAGLSSFHMLRLFKQAVGLTPVAYRNQRRLAEARRLLRQGRTVADTAAMVGFADQSHLTRHFQRVVGVSPARYAQQ